MKNRRHEKILELISVADIDTQEELQRMLSACGYCVTQATISRDIRALRLMKERSPHGGYRYIAPDHKTVRKTLLGDTVISVDNAMNTVVVKCHTGMAQAACAAIDAMEHIVEIVGTIAGDDTIFILTRDEKSAERLVGALHDTIFG